MSGKEELSHNLRGRQVRDGMVRFLGKEEEGIGWWGIEGEGVMVGKELKV